MRRGQRFQFLASKNNFFELVIVAVRSDLFLLPLRLGQYKELLKLKGDGEEGGLGGDDSCGPLPES